MTIRTLAGFICQVKWIIEGDVEGYQRDRLWFGSGLDKWCVEIPTGYDMSCQALFRKSRQLTWVIPKCLGPGITEFRVRIREVSKWIKSTQSHPKETVFR